MESLSKKAFTLIELLVVITIIGILAVGATAIYTAQIQKGRDAVRINDVKAMQSAIEQVYQDSSEYPHSNQFWTGATINVLTYMEKIPSDPKSTQQCNGSACDY
nr:prepilin-type N-terminal cleavage/methylation domain-containing protein [Candidatus Gracilibacteria bacterium]